jgi:TetR/AcrR family transcriptional regulator, transcriptional repressor of aconitase
MPRRAPGYTEERREHILAAARRAFALRGFEGTTVALLESETGLSRGAIFHYWPTKLAIFLELADRDSASLVEAMELERGPGEMLERYLERVGAEPEWLAVYIEIVRLLRRDPELVERWRTRNEGREATVRAAVERWKREGTVRADLAEGDVLAFLFTMIDGIALQLVAFPGADLAEYRALPRLVAAALGSAEHR